MPEIKRQEVDCRDIFDKCILTLSKPRLGFIEHEHALAQMQAMGMATVRHHGHFWHHGLSSIIDDAIEGGKFEFVVASDYDTVFVPQDVIDLYGLMKVYEQADAICSVQMRRGQNTVLLAKKAAGGEGYMKNLDTRPLRDTAVTRAHAGAFGLTILRLSSLKKLSRPWFLEVPDSKGGWSGDKMDADMAFWKKFDEEGFALFQANRVCVGHVEAMITWPDSSMRAMYQYPDEYDKTGKPTDSWK